MARHSRQFWQTLITEVDRGRSLVDVAARHGVRAKTLAWWRWSLTRGKRDEALGPRLLPVVVTGERARLAHQVIEILVGGTVVRIDEGADPTYVAALVRAIGARC